MTELFYPSGLPSGQGLVRLRELRDLLQPREVHRFRDVAIDGLGFHSQDVRPGNLFFAIRGAAGDGAKYAAEAVARGAVAVVAEEPLAVSSPVLVVDDCRAALADAARHYYRDPSRAVSVVGITGTNGKTTTAHLTRACLQADRRQTGLLGTIAYEFGGRRIPATNTTPDPIRIQGYLREMADRHASACVMEVSSHSLDQQRVRGVRFAVGVFTNLTQDHLDYHKTMDGYAAAKARLFAMLEPGASAVLNADDPASRRMAAVMGSSVQALWYGTEGKGDIRAENLAYSADGTRFDLVLPGMRTEVFLGLIGPHNVQNALAAAGAALSLGVSELTIASALEDVRPVPGRLELVEAPRGMHDQGIRVFVDYAHTPDALDKICACLHGLVEGRLIVVFGCGGNRDRTKRPLMARAVAKWADLAVLTSDNPRDEDPEAILDQVEEGMAGAQVPRLRVTDRSDAIRAAVAEARPGDTVLIAGKGHENYQIFQGTTVPFDDRQEAGRALAAKGGGWLPR